MASSSELSGRHPEKLSSPPPGAGHFLAALSLFRSLDVAAVDVLVGELDWLRVAAGVRLFSAGDPSDGVYGLVAGRMRFFAEEDGRSVLTADVGAGITFGEGALLSGGGRSRTAVVVRDSLLVRIRPELFASLMASSPEIATEVAGALAARVAFKYEPPADPSAEIAVVLDSAISHSDRDWFVNELERHNGAPTAPAVSPAGSPADSPAGARPARLVLFVGALDDSGLVAAVRQADRVVVLAPADAIPHPPQLPGLARRDVDPLVEPPVDLVLLHDARTALPSGTRAWLASRSFAHVHHVRRGRADDMARLARLLTGRGFGLVLGGGGARGMAHIGVIKALGELSIPVDAVGGSSIGSIIGGQLALGWTWDEMLERNEHEWASRRLRFDITVPTVSVSSGRRVRAILDKTFGAAEIEDLWLEFFCTTVNLSRFRLAVHRAGSASHWVRASASAPGLWPPVVDEAGELHIDGGQLNNVPTDVMRVGHRGPIIAVDVCAVQREMTVVRGAVPPVGLRHLLPGRTRHRFPSLVDTVNRCALLASLQHRERAADHADVYLTPDTSGIGFSGFGKIREAMEIGYGSAMEALADWHPPDHPAPS